MTVWNWGQGCFDTAGNEKANLKFAKTPVAALHQGAPGQMTWLEDPLSWLKPWLRPAYIALLCFGNSVNRK